MNLSNLLNHRGNVYEVIEWALSQKPQYPKNPAKPLMNAKKVNDVTADEAMNYAQRLRIWEKEHELWKKELELWETASQVIDNVIVEYIKEQSGLNTIPEQYRSKVYSKAWQDGHSSGFYSVYQELLDLIDIFA